MHRIVIASMLAGAAAYAQTQTGPIQSPNPAVQSHLDAAKAAAGTDFAGVYSRICREAVPANPPADPAARGAAPGGGRRSGPPPRESWHADPVKVFDNLYFLGQTEYSVWAIKTSEGLILIDAIFDYSVDDEVAGGLTTLGLDPKTIKYVVISHGHGDHSGGAKYLQDKFNARIVLTAADWDLLDRSNGTKPRRDVIAKDGDVITLGDTTLLLYNTAGHTLGTLSAIFPVYDHGERHVVATWGGTAFNWMGGSAAYITPEHPASFWFQTYSDSAERYKAITKRVGADVIISNHTIFDGSKTKLPALATRKAGEPNPYVIGVDGVQRYLTVVDECAQAGLANTRP